MARLSILGTVLTLLGFTARGPDCVYTRYGCTYVVYYDGDGGGDVLMNCDGARWYSYSGRVGSCPLED